MGQPPLQPQPVHGVRERQSGGHALLGRRVQRVLDLTLDEGVLGLTEGEPLLAHRLLVHLSHVIEILAV